MYVCVCVCVCVHVNYLPMSIRSLDLILVNLYILTISEVEALNVPQMIHILAIMSVIQS